MEKWTWMKSKVCWRYLYDDSFMTTSSLNSAIMQQDPRVSVYGSPLTEIAGKRKLLLWGESSIAQHPGA